MTAQEKINQLATAALRSGPPAPVAPKPATYMAPFDKPKTVALAEVPASAAPVASAEPAAPAAAHSLRIRIMSWLPVVFVLGWAVSLVGHILLWAQPLGS